MGPHGNQLMGLYAHEHIRGLDTDDQIVIAHILDELHLIQSTLHNSFRCDSPVFFQQRFLQGTAVDAHADGHPVFPGPVHHCLYLMAVADVAGIDADFIRPVLHGGNGQTVIKVDVRHQRNMNLLLDLSQRRGGFHGRHGHADNVAASLLQPLDLLHRGVHILGFGIAHGLNQDRVSPADDPVPNLNHFCIFPGHIYLYFLNIGQSR